MCALEAKLKELKEEPDVLSYVVNHLSATVARDDVVKRICILVAASAYSDDPQNLFLRGPSSIGKTYNVTQALKYFPAEDVWFLGGLSPTALIHDKGILVDQQGREINLDEKPRRPAISRRNLPRSPEEQDKMLREIEEYEHAKKMWDEMISTSHYEVRLYNKILVFLEAPSVETFYMLRPLLSHDRFEISYKFTDKTGKGSLRTTHVVLKGQPATIFCTSEAKYLEDLSTRGFTVTPEMNPDKYRCAIRLHASFHSQVSGMSLLLQSADAKFEAIKEYFRLISDDAKVKVSKAAEKVVVPFAEKLSEQYNVQYSRDMRDFTHLISLIKVNALINRYSRPRLRLENARGEYEEFVVATGKDFETVYNIFSALEETTRTGVPANILTFFHDTIVPVCGGSFANYEVLTTKYNENAEKPVSSRTVRYWCRILEDIGWVDKKPDPEDRRKMLVSVIKKNGNSAFSGISTIKPYLTLNFLKEWFFEQKNNVETENGITIYIMLKPGGIKISEPSDILNVVNGDFVSTLFFSDFQGLNGEQATKKDENMEMPDSARIFGSGDLVDMTPIWARIEGECAICKQAKMLTHVVRVSNGNSYFLCTQCANDFAGKTGNKCEAEKCSATEHFSYRGIGVGKKI